MDGVLTRQVPDLQPQRIKSRTCGLDLAIQPDPAPGAANSPLPTFPLVEHISGGAEPALPDAAFVVGVQPARELDRVEGAIEAGLVVFLEVSQVGGQVFP